METRKRIQLTGFKIEFSVVEDFVDGESWTLSPSGQQSKLEWC
jgi:hypothetical protein